MNLSIQFGTTRHAEKVEFVVLAYKHVLIFFAEIGDRRFGCFDPTPPGCVRESGIVPFRGFLWGRIRESALTGLEPPECGKRFIKKLA